MTQLKICMSMRVEAAVQGYRQRKEETRETRSEYPSRIKV